MKCFSEACSAAERIMEMINRVPEIDSYKMEGEIPDNISGDVEFKNVNFAYPSRPGSPILRNFCLKVQEN